MSWPTGRVPPHDLHAEQGVLAAILESNEQFDDVVEAVEPRDFYREKHRQIFEAMLSLSSRREPIDRVTVAAQLKTTDSKNTVDADELLRIGSDASTGNGVFYARIVHKLAKRRRTIEAAGSIAQIGYDGGDTDEYLDQAQRLILEATEERRLRGGPESIKTVIVEAWKQIELDADRDTDVTGLESGLTDLDRMTTGWQPGDMIILAARPGLGKTSLGVGCAIHAAQRLGRAALVFSMEMTKVALGKRILSSETGVDGQLVRVGHLGEAAWAKLAQGAGTLAQAPLDIDDTRGLGAVEIRARARRVARKRAAEGRPLSLVVVDYLGLMKTDDTNETKSSLVGRNALRLKELAGEMGLPVIVLAQLNRDPAKGVGGKARRPVLADLRDSGEIEQHADVVVFIHAEDGRHELIVEKQRNGPTGKVDVGFQAECTRFYNLRDGYVGSGEAA